ncbi:hypothetical protein GCM10027075_77080 [Streptomyces heilongjiangensis]
MEAGLRDILMPPTNQAPPSTPPAAALPVIDAAPGDSRWQATPAQRLKLRSNPRVAAASRVLHVVGSRARARDLTHTLDLARDLDPGLDLDLDLALALSLVRALARARVLANDLDFARARARALDLDLARSLDVARDRARDLADDLASVRARDLADDLASVRARDLARDLADDLADDLDPGPGLDLALDLAYNLVRVLSRALDLALARARYRCLQIISNEYTQAVGAPVAVDEESLASLMDDFTTADLSNADVREDDIKLIGVRWSDGTTWPASTDIYRLKRLSERQEDGSWIIRAGTGNVHENLLT